MRRRCCQKMSIVLWNISEQSQLYSESLPVKYLDRASDFNIRSETYKKWRQNILSLLYGQKTQPSSDGKSSEPKHQYSVKYLQNFSDAPYASLFVRMPVPKNFNLS